MILQRHIGVSGNIRKTVACIRSFSPTSSSTISSGRIKLIHFQLNKRQFFIFHKRFTDVNESNVVGDQIAVVCRMNINVRRVLNGSSVERKSSVVVSGVNDNLLSSISAMSGSHDPVGMDDGGRAIPSGVIRTTLSLAKYQMGQISKVA